MANDDTTAMEDSPTTSEPAFPLTEDQIRSLPDIYDNINYPYEIFKLIRNQWAEKKSNSDHSQIIISLVYNAYVKNEKQPDLSPVEEILLELLNITTEQEKISSKKIAQLLQESIEICQKITPIFVNVVIDVVSLVCNKLCSTKDLESLRGDSSTRRKLYEENPRLKRILEFITGLTIIPADQFALRLEPEILYVTKLTSTVPQDYSRRYMQIRTSLYYKQKRFNLIREESEGYSKLITELTSMLDSSNEFEDTYTIDLALNTIKSLIGCFKLDGNKVLNCILVALEHTENQKEQDKMMEFLKQYIQLADDSTTPANLIIFRLENTKSHDVEKIQLPKCTESWFRMIAILVKEKIIKLSDIWENMKPEFENITKNYLESLDNTVKQAGKTKISLNEDASDKNSKDKDNLSNITLNYHLYNYQKIRIVPYLFNFDMYEEAFQIIDSFPDFCIVSSLAVRISMFKFIEKRVEKFYKKIGLNKTAMFLAKLRGDLVMEDLDFTEFKNIVLKSVNYLGHYMSENSILLCKILKTTKKYAEDHDDTASLLNLLSRTALPALNLMEGNAPMAHEIWSLIEHFPFQVRFELYNDWLSENTWKSHISLAQAKIQIQNRCKWLLKRLTKENVKQYGRQIGKIAHSNPGILFKIFLSQIQRYENLIGPVIESLRYMTPLAFDTLAFCMMDELQDETKSRLQDDGASIATWLQAMAQFCGQVYKRHNMELGGLLLLIADQLKSGKSIELLLLQDVIYRMTGIEANGEPTAEQMDALSGGDVLRNEGGYYGQIKNFKKSSIKLREALQEQKLEVALVLLIALHRDRVLFGCGGRIEGGAMSVLDEEDEQIKKRLQEIESLQVEEMDEEEKSKLDKEKEKLLAQQKKNQNDSTKVDLSGAKLKLVGDMIDMCHGVMYQLGTFLCNCGSEINTAKPDQNSMRDKDLFDPVPADILIQNYHAPADIAFFLSRRYYYHQIMDKQKEIQNTKVQEILIKKQLFSEKLKALEDSKIPLEEQGDQGKIEIAKINEEIEIFKSKETEFTGRLDSVQNYCEASEFMLKDLRTNVLPLFPDNMWNDISAELYTTFWTLDNYDLRLPLTAYTKEINNIKDQIKTLDEEKMHADSRTRKSKQREKDRLTSKMEVLKDEQRNHFKHTQAVQKRLELESKNWIKNSKGDIIMKILQNLVFKRAVFSAEDSLYCSTFLLKMHDLETPNFPTLLFMDRLFTDISYTVGSLTEQQAMHYGSFMNRLLEKKLKWHSSKENFDKYCGKHPGFVTVLRTNQGNGGETQLEFESYRHVCNKWQHKLLKASITCLESEDYVQLRNILVILPRLMPNFPKVSNHAEQMQAAIEKLGLGGRILSKFTNLTQDFCKIL